jgi:hypothetical protein
VAIFPLSRRNGSVSRDNFFVRPDLHRHAQGYQDPTLQVRRITSRSVMSQTADALAFATPAP